MNKTIHILVVEDTFVAQKIIASQLTLKGCSVDVASDGIEAIEKASTTLYDLILMDIGLGEGPDGFEVTRAIKNDGCLNANTLVMAVTSHGEDEYGVKARACGMEGFFNKPFTPKDALTILKYLKEKFTILS